MMLEKLRGEQAYKPDSVSQQARTAIIPLGL